MKKTIFFALFFCSSLVMAQQEPIYSISSSQFFQNQAKAPSHETPTELPVAAKESQTKGQSEIMIISPEARAKDLLSAFQYLKKMSVAIKLGVKLIDGSLISEILDMEVMPGGTMIIFKINSMKGQKYRVVKIESIDTITHV
jgi:hypothetical protein